MIKRIYNTDFASACFFRTTVQPPHKKIMIQITEKCNLKCAHCFVDAGKSMNEMPFESIKNIIIPKLIENQVTKVTLTGGEPLVHRKIKDIIHSLLEKNISVSICTNGVLLNPKFISEFLNFDNIHFNVSLDGFNTKSHGKFRGNISSYTFNKIIDNICMLGNLKLLNGILVTPNNYASIEEYVELCEFAKRIGSKYVLMNPLSPFGRGTKTQLLSYTNEKMIELRNRTMPLNSENFEIVYIRFPNTNSLPLAQCSMGDIPYIFCNGDVAICPYMVFAAQSESNDYLPTDFILGNIFNDINISNAIKNYQGYSKTKFKINRKDCTENCGNGCQAIKISKNLPLYTCDLDLCPRKKNE